MTFLEFLIFSLIQLFSLSWPFWFFGLLYFYRKNLWPLSALLLALFAQIYGAYLIFQGGIRADEQGLGGNIFEDKLALFLIGAGLLVYLGLTILAFLKKRAPPKH